MRISRAGICNRRGFTLVELTVVIVILSVVALLVVPRIPAGREAELRGSARTLAATLRYLQDRAITGKTGYRMHLDLGSGATAVKKLSARGEEAPDDEFLGRRLLAEGVTITDVMTQRGGKRTGGEALLTFGVSGIEEFTTIHLKGAAGGHFTVMAYPSSGKVTVAEGYREEAL